MPELPEVETVVAGLNRRVSGLIIADIWTKYDSKYYYGKDNIKDPIFFKKFKKTILGCKILQSERRAKNILIHLSNKKTIIVHLKMTGHFIYGKYIFSKKDRQFIPEGGFIKREDLKTNKNLLQEIESNPLRDPFNRFIYFAIVFQNGNTLVLSDMRKFASITLIDTSLVKNIFKETGPEPFDLAVSDLNIDRFKNGKIKTVLMNPEFIAGIGNIYSDEILWEVGIHPEELVRNISNKKWKEILKFTEIILKESIRVGGDSMSDFRNIDGRRGMFQNEHKAYKLEKTICKKKYCSGVLEKITVGGRTARFCPKHQKIIK